MSLRLRILALVSLVAVTAIAATAYLAFSQASQQVTDTVEADRDTVTDIIDGLTGYARTHGTWEGVAPTVAELAAVTGQRIKLSTEWDEVIVDTDTLAGRTARPVAAPPVLADPRPSFKLPDKLLTDPDAAIGATVKAVEGYRSGVLFAACMTRRDEGVAMHHSAHGVPSYQPVGTESGACRSNRDSGDGQQVLTDARYCYLGPFEPDPLKSAGALPTTLPEGTAALMNCLQKIFDLSTADVAPVPLRVYLGAAGQPAPPLQPGPVIAAAVLVALLAVAGTALISKRVLRPIGMLTDAVHRVGAGDLKQRVPDTGRDELTRLARSFNRMADSLERGEERQRRLVADVAHELRTPLSNLRGYLEALKDGVLPASPELFASLHEEAVLQQRIVDDLQDLALAEAGVLTYHRTRVDLAELVEVCRATQHANAEAAGIALLARADGPVMVDADPDRLRQVLGNLVSNALRATPAGGSVWLGAGTDASGRATLTVRDTGVGIATDDLPHIFDRFWRPDAARGRATGGSGLGLAIARQIVTDHGGTITVDSELGTGTAVVVTLPFAGLR